MCTKSVRFLLAAGLLLGCGEDSDTSDGHDHGGGTPAAGGEGAPPSGGTPATPEGGTPAPVGGTPEPVGGAPAPVGGAPAGGGEAPVELPEALVTLRGASLEVRLLETLPAPPQRGMNAWLVAVYDFDGSAQVDCTLVGTAFMPEHGHGSPVPPEVTPTEVPGQYSVEALNLFMPGTWEITLDLTCAEVEDQVVFEFLIER
jgi:hypothetical protein